MDELVDCDPALVGGSLWEPPPERIGEMKFPLRLELVDGRGGELLG